MGEYDYIIVGAGSAGCVLAARLSEDPGVSVLLLESGGSDEHPFITMPRGLAKIMANLKYIWPYATQPEERSNNVSEIWARGRMLGGSSSVNGMVYVRGAAADFDRLAELTNDDWDWSKISEAYRKIEAHELGAGPTRGSKGPLRISLPEFRSKLTDAVIAAGEAMGLRTVTDINDPSDPDRIGYAPRTIYKGRRQSAATAFLRPAMTRKNLTVLTQVDVDRVEFEGNQAVALAAMLKGNPARYRARRDIILCAGAHGSPAILQRSGVGPAAHLAKHGIPVVTDSPEVGANLFEHRGIVLQYRVPDALSQNREFRGIHLVLSVLRYQLSRRGAMAGGAFDMAAYAKSDPSLDRPDLQLLISPYSFDYTAMPLRVENKGGMCVCVYNIRPESRGSLLIQSRDPAALPQIVPNFGSALLDREIIPKMIAYVRRLVGQAPLADLVEQETRPGAHFVSDEEVDRAYLEFGYANYHSSGTCRMGNDAAAVLDPACRVRGVTGLRVVDTSMFPFMLAGNTNAPVMALAWRAADVIRQRG
jgi:choline dehydrogenase-like flavoprotein